MSGLNRGIQPATPDRARAAAIVARFIGEQEIAQVLRLQDPFECDDPCPMNGGAPHRPIPSCGDIVCRHCSKVF